MIKDIEITCDGLTLSGTLHLPPSDNPPLVIGCHGLFANRHSPKQIALAGSCNRNGIAYLRIDHRGCGQSQGIFEEVTSLAARCRDLLAACAWARAEAKLTNRIGLFGSSMGGTVCLATAGDIDIDAIVTVAAPVRSRSLVDSAHHTTNHSTGSAIFSSPERQFDIRPKLAAVSNILLFHGEDDEIVPLDHAHEILAAVKEPKQLVVHTNGDHRMSSPVDQAEFIELATEWFRRSLIASPADAHL